MHDTVSQRTGLADQRNRSGLAGSPGKLFSTGEAMRYSTIKPGVLFILITVAMHLPFTANIVRAASLPRPEAVLQITGGTADFKVLAQDARDISVARLRGTCYPKDGFIDARICDHGAPLANLNW
jgi:hypothetical protein